MKIEIPAYINSVIKRYYSAGFEAFCVGGAVRDSIIGTVPGDWDITTNALPEETKKLFSDTKIVDTGLKHGTVSLVINKKCIEVTTYRTDGEYKDCRHPESVSFTRSLKEDLKRRDFTINAVAYNCEKGLVDPFGGCDDIYNSIIRAVGDPDRRFKEDSLRILRALRFSSVLGFDIEDATKDAIHKNRELLEGISKERIASELTKMLVGKNIFNVLHEYYDVIGVFIPEILPAVGFKQYGKKHAYDVWCHTLHTLDTIPGNKTLRLTMLLHDLGKMSTHELLQNGDSSFKNHAAVGGEMAKSILTRLKFDKKTINRVSFLVSHHDFEPPKSKTELKKKMKELTADDVKTLLTIKKSDRGALSEEYRNIEKETEQTLLWLNEIEENHECTRLCELKINGSDLLKAGLRGEEIGNALNKALDGVIEGKVVNNRNDLLTYIL